MTATPLGAAVVAALANVLGAVLVTWRRRWSATALDSLVALAAGFMISVALTEILPEAIRRGGEHAAVVALVGYLLVHLTQHSLAPHFHFGEETHEVSEVIGISALLGLLLHTFIDGVAIASGFVVSIALGTLIWLAILLHKVPEGLAISSVFLAAGSSRAKALLAAAALGAATVAGVLVTGMVRPLADAGLALSAGVTLYVAASNLVPEFQGKPGWRLPTAFFAGCGLYLVARSAIGGGR
ncbi:MAG: ZIP family metal transporter [Gemmatimonadota bacterium]|nr:ZIP family metal transporter [Gemmatimonadota bacterium]